MRGTTPELQPGWNSPRPALGLRVSIGGSGANRHPRRYPQEQTQWQAHQRSHFQKEDHLQSPQTSLVCERSHGGHLAQCENGGFLRWESAGFHSGLGSETKVFARHLRRCPARPQPSLQSAQRSKFAVSSSCGVLGVGGRKERIHYLQPSAEIKTKRRFPALTLSPCAITLLSFSSDCLAHGAHFFAVEVAGDDAAIANRRVDIRRRIHFVVEQDRHLAAFVRAG